MLQTGPHAPTTVAALDARTLGEMFAIRAARSAELPATFEKVDGRWVMTTWRRFYDDAARVAAGLDALGLAPGHRVAILGATRAAWATYDLGGQLGGYVTLGIYPKQSVAQLRYLLEHADARVVFVDSAEELRNVVAAATDLPLLVAIVPWSDALYQATHAIDPRITPPSAFTVDPLDPTAIRARQAAIDPDDTAILVYTSGTTGPPKGAMITHANILAVLNETQAHHLDFFQDDLLLSFLPMAHVAERVLAFYGRICTGVAAAYASSNGAVLAELGEVRPTVFGAVPRIFEKAHARVYAELQKKPAAARRLFAWAVRVGTARARLELAGEPVPTRLRLRAAVADRLVFRRVRAAFGGRVRFFITGAAPIARQILEFFWAAGLPVFEAYGMTEATVITHINRPGATRLGSVGRVIAPMEHKIADDGELLLRGPFVFKGYFKAPEATAATLVDGWLHTGDVGRVDSDGYLHLTDRKKHLIITAGGKNLAPANIEKAIRETTPLISQVHAHGDRRPYVCALIAPSPIETLELGVREGVITKAEVRRHTHELVAHPANRSPALEQALARVVARPAFRDAIRGAVGQGNAHLSQVERVRRFAILDRDFSQEHGELTPTLKLKRKAIEEHHAAIFERIYADPAFGLEPLDA
ncbi:MAG: long-chain fatty acid--CoA ligase [Deltaproteobacteria bacterium HGW-Deltaproteobacteria-14]|jgi:long-chain acyl-CoA synthetase|nr:MAG: long-chain fatty acid--CoA ligase [Deltaproteobacteria bacterium HGW-Deltaproteobacteria-14]